MVVLSIDYIEGWVLELKGGMKGICSVNFWFCIEYLMDYGLNGYCLKGLCLRDYFVKYILCLWVVIII